ncbi:hypothetical protein [Actinomadura chibensis]|uniref:DUF4190 domain-containing protein n=1 Tax=Actinomadura chibensis TaxID=392828 RepID=A0A5D0NNX8_9ACTN|nr:hypothetical protein [Actinomadura chibensis]TYB46102.1 hypothetical protein FXF69_12400 [Actinomadura chibensis]
MSGYGGQPPSWEDPYAGQQYGGQQYGGQQYGGSGYDPYGYGPGYGYGPPQQPYATGSNGSAIAALICTCVAVVMCCNVLAIPGIVTSAIAVSRASTDPDSSRRLAIWSWAILAASFAIGIILFVALVLLGAASEPDYDSTGGGV